MAICILFVLLLTGCGKNKANSDSNVEQPEDSATVITEPTKEAEEVQEPTQGIKIDDTYTQYVFDPAKTYQTIDGFGAAYTWYADRLLQKNNKEEAFDAFFSDGKMTILRFKNEYEYYVQDGAANANTMVSYYKNARKRAAEYGENVQVLLSCWSPPASLKENGQINGGSSLKKDENGQYCYEEYAQWWAESVEYYQSKGIQIDYVSIQNECDFQASYDGCEFATSETETQASYAKAYLAVYRAFQEKFGDTAPKMIGPETMSCNAGSLSAYMKDVIAEEPDSIYAMAHHLYVGGDSDEDTNTVLPGSFVSNFMNVSSFFEDYKKWQTEFYIGHALETATLINNSLVYENVNAYIYWSGVWEDTNESFENGQLLACYNASDGDDGWSLCADYYALRHFSEFIRPGYVRINANSGDGDVRTSVYMNEYSTKVAAVLINLSEEEKSFQIQGEGYTITDSTIYQSIFGDNCESADGLFANMGSLGEDNKITIPGKTVVTIDITGYTGDEAPVTPEPTVIELPDDYLEAEPEEPTYESNGEEKILYESELNSSDDAIFFQGFGNSFAEFEEGQGVDGTGCIRVTGRSQDWNGISLGSSRYDEYGYLAKVSFDVMMQEAGNQVSTTTTFTVGGSTFYPSDDNCRVVQQIDEAGKWYHVEGNVTLFSNMDEGSFQIYWESPGNTKDIYLDNITITLLYTEPATEYTK